MAIESVRAGEAPASAMHSFMKGKAQAGPDTGTLRDSIQLMQTVGCEAFDQVQGLVRWKPPRA